MGIAFLPNMAVKADLKRGKLVTLPWNMPDLHVVTQMQWHGNKRLSPALETSIDVVREVLNLHLLLSKTWHYRLSGKMYHKNRQAWRY